MELYGKVAESYDTNTHYQPFSVWWASEVGSRILWVWLSDSVTNTNYNKQTRPHFIDEMEFNLGHTDLLKA